LVGSSEVRIQPGSKYVITVRAVSATPLAADEVTGRLVHNRLPFGS
jgi:hypothetical protein